jgi:hypothetical protein
MGTTTTVLRRATRGVPPAALKQARQVGARSACRELYPRRQLRIPETRAGQGPSCAECHVRRASVPWWQDARSCRSGTTSAHRSTGSARSPGRIPPLPDSHRSIRRLSCVLGIAGESGKYDSGCTAGHLVMADGAALGLRERGSASDTASMTVPRRPPRRGRTSAVVHAPGQARSVRGPVGCESDRAQNIQFGAASQPSERPGCRARQMQVGRISRDGRDQWLSPYVTALQIARGMGRAVAQRPALSRCLVVASSAPADQRRRLGQGQRSRAAEPAVVAAGSGHL